MKAVDQQTGEGHFQQAARGCGACAGCRRVRHRTVTRMRRTAALGPPFLLVGWRHEDTFPQTPARCAGASLLPLRSALAAGLIATPQQTEGPFYPTAFPTDMDNDLVQFAASRRGRWARCCIWRGGCSTSTASGRRRAGRDLAVRCPGHLRPSAPARARQARFGVPGLWPRDDQGRWPLQLPHAEARRLCRPLAAHPFQGGDVNRQDADQPVLHRRRPRNERDGVFRGIRDARQRELVEMKLAPAPGVEAGALGDIDGYRRRLIGARTSRSASCQDDRT